MMHLVQIDNNSPPHAYAVLAVCSAAMRCKVTLLLPAASFSQHVKGHLTEFWLFKFREGLRERKRKYLGVCLCMA